MAVSATYRRRLLGGRSSGSLCSEMEGSSSAAPSALVIPAVAAASHQSKGSITKAAEEGNPMAILDSLAYILTLADKPKLAFSVLGQILEFVASPMARLCLRARGAIPRLLETIHLVVERSPSGECRLLQAAILRYLALDSAVRAELFDLALPDLLETLTLGMRSPLLPVPDQKDSSRVESGAESGLLKRRRCQPVAAVSSCTPASASDMIWSRRLQQSRRLGKATLEEESPSAVALVLKHMGTALGEAGYSAPEPEAPLDGVLLPLLVLRQGFREPGGETSAHQTASAAASQSILQAVLPMLLEEVPSWELNHDGRSAEPKLQSSHLGGLRLLLLLDILEACISCGASEKTPMENGQLLCAAAPDGDASDCLLHFCWRTLSLSLDKSERRTTNSPPLLREIANICLRVLYCLTQRHKAWAQLVLRPLPQLRSETALDSHWQTRAPSVLAAIVEALGRDMVVDGSDGCDYQGVSSRLALGILANLASQGIVERRAVAKHPVSANYVQRLLHGALAVRHSQTRGGSGCCSMRINDGSVNGAERGSFTFLKALALAFRECRNELSNAQDDERPLPLPEVKGDTDACVTCAVAALLIGWLMHEDAAAHALVQDCVGPTELLVDLLRQFAVFQDHCGTLTDASLVSLHAVMLSVEAHLKSPAQIQAPDLSPKCRTDVTVDADTGQATTVAADEGASIHSSTPAISSLIPKPSAEGNEWTTLTTCRYGRRRRASYVSVSGS